ncbi:MAG: DNA phosphorothioation system sulfurtransferase DndC [Alphaproteobacteria bacterium]|nr:DNA phosphorothioation system sulfurtransferase DndC [Alphaproteobacteria bacterium]MDA8030102.1 DNA phosphorothioation system sulfurtransferase DndC [Alphaproteobacteria bacterium]
MTTHAKAPAVDFSHTSTKLSRIREILSEEYCRQHAFPWIVAYSGGKDSTLLLQLVFDALAETPAELRKRQVHVVGNDTGVESPLVISHLHKSIGVIQKAIGKMDLPMTTTITKPCIDQTFWVNVIGRGYIPPTRSFRWCTDRMKIAPTNKVIRQVTAKQGKSILLVGTRKSESASRRRRMENYAKRGRRMNAHNQVDGCRIFSPLADLTDNEVWAILLQSRPPWGGTHRNLITLYRNAQSGECPLVLSKADAPACGSTSPRFGCWTCTVVAKDRSLAGLVDSGFDELEPLLDFRDWILALREKDENRMPVRRDGSTKFRADGSRVHGPFKMKVRRRILKRLKSLEKETGATLISKSEKETIEDIWRRDEVHYATRDALVEAVGAAPAV